MARFVKGNVVVSPIPFLDLKHAKRHPALVIAELEGDNLFSFLRNRKVKKTEL